jgi:hypothetical protein
VKLFANVSDEFVAMRPGAEVCDAVFAARGEGFEGSRVQLGEHRTRTWDAPTRERFLALWH